MNADFLQYNQLEAKRAINRLPSMAAATSLAITMSALGSPTAFATYRTSVTKAFAWRDG